MLMIQDVILEILVAFHRNCFLDEISLEKKLTLKQKEKTLLKSKHCLFSDDIFFIIF